jgi:hypothetical protein
MFYEFDGIAALLIVRQRLMAKMRSQVTKLQAIQQLSY